MAMIWTPAKTMKKTPLNQARKFMPQAIGTIIFVDYFMPQAIGTTTFVD